MLNDMGDMSGDIHSHLVDLRDKREMNASHFIPGMNSVSLMKELRKLYDLTDPIKDHFEAN